MQNTSDRRIRDASPPEADAGLDSRKRRPSVSQQDFPSCPLKEALRIPKAIFDRYAGLSASAADIAAVLELSPAGGYFRALCGAAVAYGLTDGSYNSREIVPTPLARRILQPSRDEDDLVARQEAFLRPKFTSDFLTRYNGQRLPNETVAHNTLASLGVPHDRLREGFELICTEIKELGLSRTIGGHVYVALPVSIPRTATQARELASSVEAIIAPAVPKASPPPPPPPVMAAQPPVKPAPPPPVTPARAPVSVSSPPVTRAPSSPAAPAVVNVRRVSHVYVSRGPNLEVAKQLHELLTSGHYRPVVSIEEISLTMPISPKVLDQMRSCDAAVIHVGMDRTESGTGGQQLNENVLIEIGAAMALYEGRIVILAEEGVRLPSNVQGILEVRYRGSELTYSAAMTLLKKLKDFG